MKILVTGASGFFGRHILAALSAHRPEASLIGISREGRIEGTGLTSTLSADLADEAEAHAALADTECEVCVHVAGSVPPQGVEAMFRSNVRATANLLNHLRARRLVLISSAAVYGAAGPSGLVTEQTPPDPVGPYGLSCLARECVARMFCDARGVELVVLRIFNLIGPGQSEHMMVPAFARQVALIEAGRQGPHLRAGRLDTWRDYVDVRDAALAVTRTAFAADGPPPTLNIGSGVLWSGQQLLERLLSLTDLPIQVVSTATPERLSDVPRLGNGSPLAATAIGWTAARRLCDTLSDVLADWRARVGVAPKRDSAPL